MLGSMRRIVIVIVGLLLFYGSHFAISRALIRFYPRPGRHTVEGVSPLPVVVISRSPVKGSYQASAVFRYALDGYLKTLGSYSFLIPKGEIDRVNKQLAEQVYSREKGFFGPSSVEVIATLDTSRQSLRVTGTYGEPAHPATVTGWYIASKKGFTPRYIRSFSPSRFHAAMYLLALPLTVILWALGISLYLKTWRKRGSPDQV